MKASPLNSVFDGLMYSFVADSREVCSYILNNGQECLMYKKGMRLPDNCVNVQTSVEHFLSLESTASLSPVSKILTIPLVAFDNSFECFKYLFHQLQNCDFLNVYSEYKRLMSTFKDVGPRFSVTSDPNIHLTCHFGEKVSFSYPKNVAISKGKIRSVAEYFEVNFNHLYPDLPSPFELNGKFRFSSCLYAIHPSTNDISSKQLKCAKKLFKDTYQSNNCIMVIEKNNIKSFKIDDVERVDDVVTIAGNSRKSTITEFAFGLNSDIYEHINWSYNSQINEGCSGIHLGVGDGKTGIHMDFISPVKNDKALIVKELD